VDQFENEREPLPLLSLVPTHGHDWKKKQATQSRKSATKNPDEHMGTNREIKFVIPNP
jgi:hypothetical protein